MSRDSAARQKSDEARRSAAAIVVAGGQGRRFGGKVRKQYLTLCGRPLFAWAIDAFQRSPSVGAIILVVPQEDAVATRRQIARWIKRKPVHVVAGGATRSESVRHGLAAVPPEFHWIAVHDAVRPLVTVKLIEQVLKQARAHRAAIAANPSKDTVKLASVSRTIQRTLPRQLVWLAQTPQAFERKLLEKAHQRGAGVEATDDAFLVERLGVRVKLVESNPENLKVTVPADFHMAKRILLTSPPARRLAGPSPDRRGNGVSAPLSHRERGRG